MAKKRRSTAKSSKKPLGRKKSSQKPRLSAAERLTLLKPGDDLNEFLSEVATALRAVERKVRVDGLSATKLESLARKAEIAAQREAALIAKQQAKLAPLTDARIIARDAAYRAGLKVKRIADALAADDADVAAAFAVVTERFRRGPTNAGPPPA